MTPRRRLPDLLSRVIALFDRRWLLVALAIFPVVVFLNYDALGMQGIVPNYVCLKQTILAGFDPTPPGAPECTTPTFPIWGYAWLLVVTESKLALLVFQNLAAIAAVWFLVRTLEREQVLDATGIRVLKLLVVFSLPWYAFNSLRWPYSIAVSLVLVALALLIRGTGSRPATIWPFVGAGAAFGLALNFRSDYIAVPILVAFALTVLPQAPLRRRLRSAGAWLLTCGLMLLPWAAYTQHVTGDPLLTSTNSGHVLFISLGNLPGNTWGITPTDGDPRMVREVRAEFGHEQTLIRESDSFLRARFVELVVDEPAEYARKVVHNFLTVPGDGVYSGEFFEQQECQPDCLERYSLARVFTASDLGVGERARYIVWGGSAVEARVVPLLAVLVLPLYLALALRRRQVAHVLVGGIFAFQVALNSFAFTMSAYLANAYVPMLVLLAWGVERVLARRPWQARSVRAERGVPV